MLFINTVVCPCLLSCLFLSNTEYSMAFLYCLVALEISYIPRKHHPEIACTSVFVHLYDAYLSQVAKDGIF